MCVSVLLCLEGSVSLGSSVTADSYKSIPFHIDPEPCKRVISIETSHLGLNVPKFLTLPLEGEGHK